MAHEFTVREESEKSEITGMKFCSKRFGCKQDCAKSKNLKFGSPIEVGCYSVDGEREFRHDGSELAYLYLPKENKCGRFFDLSRGYEDKKNVKKPNRLFTGIYHLLTWARLNLDKVFGPDSADPTFFGYRHIFTKIMCSPYDCKTAWNLLAIKLNDTIFLAEYRTVAQHEQNENLPHYVKKCQFWGRKAEMCLTSRNPGKPPSPKEPINEFRQFRSIIRTQLGAFELMLGCEIDSVDPKSAATGTARYVEIKTQREIKDERTRANFRRNKLYKWWAQSVIGGVPRIQVAYRNDKGIVNSLESMKTASLPAIAALESEPWRPKVMTRFLHNFLAFVKSQVRLRSTCYIFEFDPHFDAIKFTFDKDKTKEYYFMTEEFEDAVRDMKFI